MEGFPAGEHLGYITWALVSMEGAWMSGSEVPEESRLEKYVKMILA